MKIKIKTNITEQQFMEGLLNMKHSGYKVGFYLAFYGLAKSWHIDKLTYYIKLLEEK